jgi:hypothetical protein
VYTNRESLYHLPVTSCKLTVLSFCLSSFSHFHKQLNDLELTRSKKDPVLKSVVDDKQAMTPNEKWQVGGITGLMDVNSFLQLKHSLWIAAGKSHNLLLSLLYVGIRGRPAFFMLSFSQRLFRASQASFAFNHQHSLKLNGCA